jgi:hypothetical protein
MKTETITRKRNAEDVGQKISLELADYLKNGFKQRFPEEKPAVFISKESILKAIENIGDLSGIRFMYGLGVANDPKSKVVIMIPCNNTSTHLPIPNSIMLPQGYMAHTGDVVSFENTWKILYNHTVHFNRYFAELPFNKIMRGSFMGINSLLSLISIEDCAGINFNFGYDETISEIPARNRPVFEAVNIWGDVPDGPWDFTTPCPSLCDYKDTQQMEQLAAVNIEQHQPAVTGLKLNSDFRDGYLLKQESNGSLVEMYYYATPSINEKMEAIRNSGAGYNSVYEPQIKLFNDLIAEGSFTEAKTIFESTITGMIDTYLFQ